VLTRQIRILDEEQFDGVVLQCHLEFVSVMHYGGIESCVKTRSHRRARNSSQPIRSVREQDTVDTVVWLSNSLSNMSI
jgi:hypothetical protein